MTNAFSRQTHRLLHQRTDRTGQVLLSTHLNIGTLALAQHAESADEVPIDLFVRVMPRGYIVQSPRSRRKHREVRIHSVVEVNHGCGEGYGRCERGRAMEVLERY